VKKVYIGIDPPGKHNLGYAVVEANSEEIEIMESGTYVLQGDTLIEKAIDGAEWGEMMIKKYSPDAMVFEKVGGGGFAQLRVNMSTLCTGVMIGAYTVDKSLVFNEISPKTAKKAVTGSGNASKKEVAAGVANVYNIDPKSIKKDHESDALAVIYAFLQQENGSALEKNK